MIDFALPPHELHPSGLRTLTSCLWRSMAKRVMSFSDESGPAADTGSATHRAIAAFHKGMSISDSLDVMQSNLHEYKHADLSDAAALFIQYAADSRNKNVDMVMSEEPIDFTISCAPYDPTGQPIYIIGRLDQVRRENGRLKLWDTKTSKKDPNTVLLNTQYQAAAYCVGASIKLGEPVEPGGIIMPRLYKGKDPSSAPVHRHFVFKLKDCEHILEGVRHAVAQIRMGHVYHNPGADNCDWCPLRSPDLCLPKLQELKLR